MFNFFPLLLTVCVFYGAEAVFASSEADDAVSSVPPSNITYVYVSDENESQNQSEVKTDQYLSENEESYDKEEYDGENVENSEEYDTTEVEDAVSIVTSSDISKNYNTNTFTEENEDYTETTNVTVSEGCSKDSEENTGNNPDYLKCFLPNESLKCVKSCPRPKTCATRNIHYKCPNNANETCSNECVCDDGYYRNSDGFCVSSDLCESPKCSLPNESLKCVKSCPRPRTCATRNIRYKCPNNANETCSNECVCNDGFYRNSDGFCVTYDLCDKKCTGPNEEYKADKKTCPLEVCPSELSVIRFACNPNEVGQPGCVCKPGFFRSGPNATCIPKEQCPGQEKHPKCFLPNESLKCVKSCPRPRTCATRNIHYKCPNNANETCSIKSPKCSLPNESIKCVKSCPRPRTCATRNLRYKCPNNVNETCTNECVCNDGFYRNSDGLCVTSDLCDKKCRGPNEEYKADKKTCPPEICKSIVSRYACDPKEVGQPGCVCKSGFLRLTLNSTCIPTKECPEMANQHPKCFLPNESLKCVKSCPRPKTCATRNIHYKCPNNANETCSNECVCDDGYYRNSDGFCVSSDRCEPLQCTLPNESLKCLKPCQRPRTCATRRLLFRCKDNANATCKNECVCNDGFYRNSDGFCVTSELCDKKCLGPNEEYKADKKTCPPEICASIVSRYACDPKEVGQPGCVCKSGFLRRTLNSTCIPTNKCPELANQPPECTLPNESLTCVKSCPHPRTCATRNIQYLCPNFANEPCKYDCTCNNGFYRNSDGLCVTYDLCDKKCTGPNEEYKADKKTCPLEICPSKLSLIRYACDPNEVGRPGCACKPGFFRLEANSTCIPKDQCPGQSNTTLKCTLPNESAQCVKSCPGMRNCENRGKIYHCPNMPVNASCTYKCACNEGYYRNSDGFCVTSELCDKKCPRPNEVYKADKKTCPLEICPSSKFVIRFACNPKEVGQPGCVCKPGFFRSGPNSTCIPQEECPGQEPPKCNLPNESLKCVKSCPEPWTCATRDLRYKCFDNKNETCKVKCVCDDGFYRNSDGFCVTYDLCDKKCTEPNEEYKADKKTCPLELCPSKLSVIRYACNPNEVGQPGCACKPGFRRLSLNSTCIPIEECPGQNKAPSNCSLPNESLTCVKSCPPLRTCENRGKLYSCPFMAVNATCTKMCACNDGFYRNSDGFCVTSELCDKKCPRPNEVYKADKKTCPLEICPSSKFVIRYACNPKEVGQPGCVCKPGFFRSGPNSTCIPKDQCPGQDKPIKCILPHESLKCMKSCPRPRTCATRNLHYKCAKNLNETCTNECVCDDDYYRNSDGFCVKYDQCDKKCTGPNEEYKADKKTCPLEICPSKLSLIRYACDPNEVGQPGCACKPGFFRLEANSTCIPKDQCPGQSNSTLKCTLPNESAQCVKSCPGMRTCENRDKIYHCPKMAINASCTYECACNDGYYRNSDGFCVTSVLCDKKCTRPNEVYKADKKTCPLETCPSSKFVIHYACSPKEVGQPGCVCKPGFFRSGPNSTCIPKDQCPGQSNTTLKCTLPNESAQCVKSCPGMRTCENRDKIYHCPNMPVNASCTYKCACNDGYYRNSDGFCVTSELCDKKCPRPNEVYKADKKTCPLETCPSSKFVILFACNPKEVGQPGCVCKPGFFRSGPNSTCIPKDQCPDQDNLKCTRPNEVYKADKKSCPPELCPSKFAIRYACNPKEVGKPGCVCRPGFLRISPNSTCIPKEQCPSQDNQKCTRPNEVYKADKKSCPLELCPSKFAIRYACNPKEVGKPGCVCRPGFLRISPNSTCIPKEQCPRQDKPKECTLPNESLKCVKSCPRPRTCLNRRIHYKCYDVKNETCRYECVCNDGFYRNSDGFCVTYNLCGKKCPRPNEIYKPDKKNCPPQTCESIRALYKCDSKEKGQPGCVCKPGFLRLNPNSTCIPSSKCPQNSKTSDSCNGD